MIPKKIHYCWFGRNPLPESAQKCIASWRKYLPDYEIIEWNEDKFDVFQTQYTAEAYQAKKYAFVSDYARFNILYEQGGLYFDTDVEVIKSFDDIISNGSFLGFEINPGREREYGAVNPGLGMGADPGMEVYKTILDYYSGLNFILPNGEYNITDAVVNITTRELEKFGLCNAPGIQNIQGIKIYPAEYFNPYNDITGKLKITSNTVSIHWYSKTWIKTNKYTQKMKQLFHRFLGISFTTNFKNFLKK